MIKGKKGEERILSIWWILIISIIGVLISIGVIMFYSYYLDVRGQEAEILFTKISDCLVEDGYLSVGLTKADILSKCKLDEKILKNAYFLKINDTVIGNGDYEAYCKLEGTNYPICKRGEVYALDRNENNIEKIKIEILVASNNAGKKLT